MPGLSRDKPHDGKMLIILSFIYRLEMIQIFSLVIKV